MKSREVAWRVFAAEYSTASVELKGEGDRAPSFVVTPMGAMINRLFVAGVLTDSENIGTEDEPMWRARITDPTGTFYVSAGRYQPEAATAISRISVPSFVAVVGKSRTYSPEEGKFYVSIRPEKIVEIDSDMRDYWVLETCKATLDRIAAMEDAINMDDPDAEALMGMGHARNVSLGIVEALKEYGPPDLNRYRALVLESLKYLLPGMEVDLEIPETVSDVPEEIELDLEEEGGDLDKEKMKIGKTELEELTNSLLDKGLIYEPVLGRMKRI
jgi:RPA family protein